MERMYSIIFLIIFAGVYGSFVYLSKLDRADRRALISRIGIPLLIMMAIFYYLFEYVKVSYGACIPTIVIASMIGYTYPVLYYVTTKREGGMQSICSFPYDVITGIYMVSLLMILQVFFQSVITNTYVWAIMFAIVVILFLLPSIFLWMYYGMYRMVIDVPTMQTILYTNRREATEFINTCSFKQIVANMIGVVVICMCVIYVYVQLPQVRLAGNDWYILAPICIALIVLLFVGKKSYVKRTAFFKMLLHVVEFQKELAVYTQHHQEVVDKASMTSPLQHEEFGTVIVVIGESANRQYMHAFSNCERENTPWLTEESKGDNFILFKNAYAAFFETAKALELALTSANQYNDEQYTEAISMIDLAKACGFETYWFSNQGIAGIHDTSTSVLAKSADVHRWSEEDYATQQYDIRLLEYMKQIPRTKKNKLIVLHLMGSHAPFSVRYPKEFSRWPVEIGEEFSQNAYDNSLLFTDHVLEQVYTIGKEELNLQAMVYFSDHGSEINQPRKPYFTSFNMVMIPLFVYLSDAYKQCYEETYHILRDHEDAYITNDLLYNLVAGILQVKGDVVCEEENIASANYGYNRCNLRTDLGRRALTDDDSRQ